MSDLLGGDASGGLVLQQLVVRVKRASERCCRHCYDFGNRRLTLFRNRIGTGVTTVSRESASSRAGLCS